MATHPDDVQVGDGLDSLSTEVPEADRAAVEPSQRQTRRREPPLPGPQTLGWLSIGLGVATLLAPRPVSRATGLQGRESLLRLVGARELASGVGLLTQQQKRPWLWSRVLGDIMDLALIAGAIKPANPGRYRALTTAAIVSAIAVADVAASVRNARSRRPVLTRADAYLEASVIVNKTPDECYAFWRDVRNLPKFTRSLESIAVIDDSRSHWVLRGPLGSRWEWDSRKTVDRPGECIAWKSMEGAELQQVALVSFDSATGGRGTRVQLSLHYQPRAGSVGASIAKVFGADPRSEARQDLARFKQLIESGEIATTRGQPSGRRSLVGRATSEGRLSRAGRTE
jgi:uncharacterized membrane protein